jgi:hypothetical protein
MTTMNVDGVDGDDALMTWAMGPEGETPSLMTIAATSTATVHVHGMILQGLLLLLLPPPLTTVEW